MGDGKGTIMNQLSAHVGAAERNLVRGAATAPTPSGLRASAPSVVALVLGAALLLAAALKGHELATRQLVHVGTPAMRWLWLMFVDAQAVLSLWLLFFGFAPRWIWKLCIACFAGFACIAAWKVSSGAVSCGCLGSVPVNPRFMLVFDALAVAALVGWPPPWTLPRPRGVAATGRGILSLLAILVVLCVSLAIVAPSPRASILADDGEITGDGDIVVVDPDQWPGKPFPLLKHIDIGVLLATGDWTVVVYRHDCPRCLEALEEYEAAASSHAFSDAPIVLIELPLFAAAGPDAATTHSRYAHGRLSAHKTWLVESPLEVQLSQGVVVRVGRNGPVNSLVSLTH